MSVVFNSRISAKSTVGTIGFVFAACLPHYNLFQNSVCRHYTVGMNRHELTDAQWAVIEPLLPQQKPGPGRRPADHRRTLNGVLYVLKTSCAWEDMPRKYGSPTRCCRRLQTWSQDGTWERVWRALLSQLDAQSKLEWA
jgi:transposase